MQAVSTSPLALLRLLRWCPTILLQLAPQCACRIIQVRDNILDQPGACQVLDSAAGFGPSICSTAINEVQQGAKVASRQVEAGGLSGRYDVRGP